MNERVGEHQYARSNTGRETRSTITRGDGINPNERHSSPSASVYGPEDISMSNRTASRYSARRSTAAHQGRTTKNGNAARPRAKSRAGHTL